MVAARVWMVASAVLLGSAALVAGSDEARAEPMVTSLTEVMAQTDAIVVGTYLGLAKPDAPLAGYRVDIERVAWGAGATTGRTVLGVGSGQVSGTPGTRMVILISSENAFGFAASPVAGGSIERGLLQVQGFYDYNAHLITPSSLLTLDQLVTLAKGGNTLAYRVRGRIHVLTDDGQSVVPTGPELTVTHRRALVGASTTAVTGFEPQGLPAPSLSLGIGIDRVPTVHLGYRNSWPRPLMLRGEIQSVDPDGTLRARFVVSQPDLLTAKQLATYTGDPKLSHPRWRGEVRLETGERWVLEDGAGYTGSPALTLSADAAPIRVSSMDLRGDKRLIRYGYLNHTFELALGPAPKGATLDPHGTSRTFRQELLAGPIPCIIRGGPYDGTAGEIVLTGVRFEGPVRAK